MSDRTGAFTRLPPKPDHHALELAVLERWEQERTFERLRDAERRRAAVQLHRRAGHREQVAGGPHRVGAHPEGRVPALQGAARLPPALPERLRLPGPLDRGRRGAGARPQLEAGDRGVRPGRVRRAGAGRWSSGRRPSSPQGSIRLGQWMDWGRDYFTFSDTNIEYIWRFLAIVHERGLALPGPPVHGVVPPVRHVDLRARAGRQLRRPGETDPSLSVRFPLLDRPGEAIVIWTTTPWTLPANVAAAVNPAAEYGLRADGDWLARARYPRRAASRRSLRGASWSGCATRALRRSSARGAAVDHRVIAWDEVSLEEGTGVVHIAPGCGTEDFELSKVARPRRADARRRVRPLLPRVRLAGRPLGPRGRRRHHRRPRPSEGCWSTAGTISHRYPRVLALPHAPDLPHLRRLVHLRRRDPRADARGQPHGRVDARVHGQAHGRLARATCPTGTSPAAATTGCRSPSTRAPAATSP